MSVFTILGAAIASPVDAAGNKRSVDNGDMQRWMTEVERMFSAFQSGGGIIFPDLATANASLAYAQNQMAWVMGDPTPANNGVYRKIGASGSGSWARMGDLPFSMIRLDNAGAGTADAIVATPMLPLPTTPGAALLTVNILADNTGNVTINTKPLRTNSGNEIAPGGLTAGSIHAFIDLGDHFRLMSDQASAAIAAAAEAWANVATEQAGIASASADRAEGFAAMESADKVKFKAVSLLLADNLMSYSPGEGLINVGPGDIIEAQGFRYEVAALIAADYYLETAGGVKLYVLPAQDGWVSTEAVNNNPALLQKLIDNFSRVRSPAGVTFALTSGLVASSKCAEIDFSGATFDLNVEGTFFSGPGTILANRIYRLGFIRVNRPNSKGIDWTWFSYCTFSAFTIRLGGANSDAVYARGNGLGTGPYYNNISDFYAYGMNNNATYPNQRLLAFERAASGGFSADGPNGNNLSNIKRLAAAAIAVDMQSGNGNKFSNVQVEAISQEIFAFNNHGGSEQKAAGNTITNWRVEGSTTAVTCHFYVGSRSNKVTNGFETSTGPVKLINDSDYSNVYAPAGREVTLDFFGTIGTAGTVHNLSPARTGAFGGAAVPFSGYVHSVVARARGVPSNVVGTATVKVYKTGTLNDTLPAMVFNNPNYSDRRAVAPGWSVTDPRQVCSWESGHALAVDVETSADWSAASGQVHVQVVFMA